jgi:hypothetical protein
MRYLVDREKRCTQRRGLPSVESITDQKLIEKGLAGAVNAEIDNGREQVTVEAIQFGDLRRT